MRGRADIDGPSSRANPNPLDEYRPYLMVRSFRGREGGVDRSIQAIMAPIRTSRRGMSAFGGKADVNRIHPICPLIAITGHPAARPKSKIGCTENSSFPYRSPVATGGGPCYRPGACSRHSGGSNECSKPKPFNRRGGQRFFAWRGHHGRFRGCGTPPRDGQLATSKIGRT